MRPLNHVLRYLAAACAAGVVLLVASPVGAQSYPSKPVRFIVPFPQGGRVGSRRRGRSWGGDGARPPGSWHGVLRLIVAALVAAASLFALPSFAQNYPSKPVRFIVPFPPGGGTDILARIIGQKMGERWGQQFPIDNRPGAATNIGMEMTAKAPPDGYTLLMISIGLATNGSLYKKLTFNPLRDLAPVSLVAIAPTVLTVHPSLPVKTAKDVVALAKTRRGQLNYGSYGAGSSAHLAAELFQYTTGVEIVHVPYRGGGPAITALLSGEVHMLFTSVVPVLPHIKSGRAHAIALASAHRSSALPGIATFRENNIPFDMGTWFGVMAPAGTPREVITQLQREIARIIGTPEVKERIASEGAEPVGNTPEEFAAFINSEATRWAKVIQSAKITPE
jgi:tripartite-type tricarboxylate transporter receptor subunit TctC